MDEIAFRYDERKNPEGKYLPGVPLRDLTPAEFKALPKWLQGSVKAAEFYIDTKPAPIRKVQPKEGE